MSDEEEQAQKQHLPDIYWRLSTLEQQNDKLYDSMMTLTRSVDSLTQSVSTMQSSVDRYDQVEKQMTEMQTRLTNIDKLWEQVDTLRIQNAERGPILSGAKGLAAIGTSSVLSAVATAVAMSLV